MLNEERIILMTQMASYEQGEGKENVKIGNYSHQIHQHILGERKQIHFVQILHELFKIAQHVEPEHDAVRDDRAVLAFVAFNTLNGRMGYMTRLDDKASKNLMTGTIKAHICCKSALIFLSFPVKLSFCPPAEHPLLHFIERN